MAESSSDRDSMTARADQWLKGPKAFPMGEVGWNELTRDLIRDLLADRARLAQEPALVTYMQAETRGDRSAAFLRTYAERIRNGTAASWEIPNTVADTLEDIAKFIAASADDTHAFDNGSGMTEVMTVPEMIAEIQRLGRRCEELYKA